MSSQNKDFESLFFYREIAIALESTGSFEENLSISFPIEAVFIPSST